MRILLDSFSIPRSAADQLRTLVLGMTLAVSTVLATPARAVVPYLPAVSSDSAPIVSPSSAWTYYSGLGVSSPALATTRDFRIKDLAITLQNDPDRIYEYVRNSIEFTPMFGVKKGALGALLSEHGTAFDQAQLMVELLREAGYSASYQYGTITLTGPQLGDWLGITDTKGTESTADDTTNAVVATNVLANGGIPAAITSSGSTVTQAVVSHVWVLATIGGATYSFDPSYKPHKIYDGIDIGATIGFNETSFMSSATSGVLTGTDAGIGFIRDINTGQIDSQLTSMSTTLYNHIKTNMASSSLEEVIGGKRIIDDWDQHRDVGLAGHAGTTTAWAGEIPNVFRTVVDMSVLNLTAPLFLDEVFQKTISIGAELQADINYVKYYISHHSPGTLPATIGYSSQLLKVNSGSPTVTIAIDHPYAAIGGSYMDASVLKVAETVMEPSFLSTFSFILNTGHVGSEESREFAHRAANVSKAGGYLAGAEALVQRVLQIQATSRTMLTEMTRSFEFSASLAGVIQQHHHSLGVANQVSGSELMIDFDTAISVTSLNLSVDDEDAYLLTAAAIVSEVEAGVFERTRDVWEPMSGARMLEYANTGSNRKYYDLPALGDVSVLSSTLVSYDTAFKGFVQDYLDEGYRVVLPKRGVISFKGDYYNGFAAGTFIAIDEANNKAAYVTYASPDSTLPKQIRKGGSGAAGSADIEDVLKQYKIETSFSAPGVKASFGGVNTDLHTGAVTMSVPRMSVGQGEFPYSLDFVSTYSSDDESAGRQWWDFDSIKNGWTHNWRGRVEFGSDFELAMGSRQADDAAASIVALFVAQRINSGTKGFENYLVSPFVANWWMRGIASNMATVRLGSKPTIFVRKPDGTFNTPVLSTAQLVRTAGVGRRSCVEASIPDLGNKNGSIYHGTKVTYTDDNGIAYVFDHVISYEVMACNNWHLQLVRVDHPSGVSVALSYHPSGQLKKISNSIGKYIDISLSNNGDFCFPDDAFLGCKDKIDFLTDVAGRSLFIGAPVKLPIAISPAAFSPQWGVSSFNDLAGNTVMVNHEDHHLGKDFRLHKIFIPSVPAANPLNNVFDNPFLQLDYDVRGRVRSITDADGNVSQILIGKKRTDVINALAQQSTILFDDQGRAVESIDPLGRSSTAAYDGTGHMTSATMPKGNAIEVDYDTWHNVVAVRAISSLDPNDIIELNSSYAPVTTLYRTVYNRPEWVEDALGNRTDFTYYATTGYLQYVDQPSVDTTGNKLPDTRPRTANTYDAWGRLVTATDPQGMVTKTIYDVTTGFKTSQIVDFGGLNLTTTFGYSELAGAVFDAGPLGDILNTFDPLGKVTHSEYDVMRRPVKITPASGAVATATYNVDGQVEAKKMLNRVSSAVLQSTTTTYNARGLPETVTDPQLNVTTTTYDALGRPDVVTDAEGRSAKTLYTITGQVEKVFRAWRSGFGPADPDITTCAVIPGSLQQCYQTYTYDEHGKPVSVADAKSNVTAYAYDGHDRLWRTTFPNTTTEEVVGFDDSGNILELKTRGGLHIWNEFDALGRQTKKIGDVTVDTLYRLDSLPSVVSDSQSQSLTHAYDTAGRLASVRRADMMKVSYLYDAASNRTRVANFGIDVDYAYDEMNRMAGVCLDATATFSGGTMTCSTGTPLATYSYDELGRRDAMTYGNGTSVAYTFEVDNDLAILAHSFTGTSLSYTFTHNNVHQMLTKVLSDTATYGWIPNVDGTENYSSNILNQYTVVAGQDLTYDGGTPGNGNLTSDGANSYTYDRENRLISADVTVPSPHTVAYTYDPLGRRIKKRVDGNLTIFLHDGDEEIAEFGYHSGNMITYLKWSYVYGPSVDERIAMVAGDYSTIWYHTDHQGSTVAMSDASGTVTDTYTYDEFGNSSSTNGQPFRYTGRRLDDETGLYYYRARYYSPTLGRFMQTDPVGYEDQMNLYAYVGNDPVNLTDPSGMTGTDSDPGPSNACQKTPNCNYNTKGNNFSKTSNIELGGALETGIAAAMAEATGSDDSGSERSDGESPSGPSEPSQSAQMVMDPDGNPQTLGDLRTLAAFQDPIKSAVKFSYTMKGDNETAALHFATMTKGVGPVINIVGTDYWTGKTSAGHSITLYTTTSTNERGLDVQVPNSMGGITHYKFRYGVWGSG